MTHFEDKPLEGRRAAVMVGPLFEDIEALYPLYRLREAGAVVASSAPRRARPWRARRVSCSKSSKRLTTCSPTTSTWS